MAAQSIIILGGGVGGTLVANLLARKLTRKQASITLIDRSGLHVYQPGWLYVPFGGAPPEQLERPERRLLNSMVDLVVGDAARIDVARGQVDMTDGESLPFDYLVLACGASLAPAALPGFAEGAQHFYSAEASLRLHAALRDFQGGRIVVSVAALPYKYLPAPLEFTFLLEDYLGQQGLRDRSELLFTYPLERAFPISSVADMVEPLLAERGIGTRLSLSPAAIDPQARIITPAAGAPVAYDLLVMVPPHRGAQVLCESGLGDAEGWVPTNPETLQARELPNVYALGDATDLPFSKSGAAAHFEARVIAARLTAAVLGMPDDTRYNGQVMYFLEVGRGQASQLVFDYTHAPQPPQPSAYFHYEKALMNRAYWHLVPNGLL